MGTSCVGRVGRVKRGRDFSLIMIHCFWEKYAGDEMTNTSKKKTFKVYNGSRAVIWMILVCGGCLMK